MSWPEAKSDEELYARVLDEQKLRSDSAKWFLDGGDTYINLESAALQLRQMLELIPLGALVANRDWVEPVASAFAKKKPGEAKGLVERVNPEYWPKPGLVKRDDKGLYTMHALDDGYVTESEWADEWGWVSGLLHARNPYKGHPDQVDAHQHLRTLHARLLRLLAQHVLALPDQDRLLIGTLQSANGSSSVASLSRLA
jgi:hypothetical protein